MNKLKAYLCMMICLLLTACAGMTGQEERFNAAETYFRSGTQAMQRQDYETAILRFTELETHYPFDVRTEHARLEMLYAYFEQKQYSTLIALADSILVNYPVNEQRDYVIYMRGLASFAQGFDALISNFNIDLSTRDIGKAEQAFTDFHTLLIQYPHSIYAADARKRMIYLRNRLAASEIYIARFYLKKQAWLAAANRGQYVLQNYAGTASTIPALRVMIQAYQAMGMTEKAEWAKAILDMNTRKKDKGQQNPLRLQQTPQKTEQKKAEQNKHAQRQDAAEVPSFYDLLY